MSLFSLLLNQFYLSHWGKQASTDANVLNFCVFIHETALPQQRVQSSMHALLAKPMSLHKSQRLHTLMLFHKWSHLPESLPHSWDILESAAVLFRGDNHLFVNDSLMKTLKTWLFSDAKGSLVVLETQLVGYKLHDWKTKFWSLNRFFHSRFFHSLTEPHVPTTWLFSVCCSFVNFTCLKQVNLLYHWT